MRLATPIFIAMLGLNGAFALLLGVNSLLNFRGAMDSFGVLYNDTMAPLGTVTASQFLLQGAMLLMAIAWTRRRNPAGVSIGVAVGVYLIFLTLVEVGYGRGQLALIADLPRGVLLTLFGIVASSSQHE
jgi:hypothetical protein